jgi:NTE family protein
MAKRRKKVGLALGSGGAKGLSHVGVIKVLQNNKIPIDYIAGSSIGSLIGGIYAATEDIKKIEDYIIKANWKKIFSLIDPTFKGGVIGGEKVKQFIERYTENKNFDELKIKFAAVATSLRDGEPVVLNRGSVAEAIRASSSFPLLFKPIKKGRRVLSDGGLSMPVPVRVVREMGADIVIAVNLDSDYFNEDYAKEKRRFYHTANNSINIMRYHLASFDVKDADFVISPKIGNVNWGKFLDGQEVVVRGERATEQKIPEIKQKLKS